MAPLPEFLGESVNNLNPPYTMNQAHNGPIQLLPDLALGLPMFCHGAESGHSEHQTSHPSTAP